MKVLSKTLTLIGFQTSGKTTLGQLLAQHLGCSFVDTDQLIEQFHSFLSCRSIFQIFGSSYFRFCERQIIASLKYQPAIVLAPGGGCLIQEVNVEKLQMHSFLIYLKTSPEILKKRIWQRQSLPAYLPLFNSDQAFFHLYQERVKIYEKCTHYSIEMDDLSIENALQKLIVIAKDLSL